MRRDLGKSEEGLEHLQQSILDILTTPIGSRVMRRNYGSKLFQLIDAPVNNETIIDIYAAVAEALSMWENRIEVYEVKVTDIGVGELTLSITGKYLINGETVTLDGLKISK